MESIADLMGTNEAVLAYDMYEHRNGAPKETGEILFGGHIAFQFETSEFEEGPHKVQLIPNQSRTDITRKNIGLHQALVTTANEMIQTATREISAAGGNDMDWESLENGDVLTDAQRKMLTDAFAAQQRSGAGTGQRRRARRARDDDDDDEDGDDDEMSPQLQAFILKMKQSSQWRRVRLQTIVMGEIEANCKVNEERGNETGGERFLKSEVWMSNLCYPTDVSPPDRDIVNWSRVLMQIIQNNRKRAAKPDKGPPPPFCEFSAIDKVMSGYQFIEEFILPMVPHSDMSATATILDPKFVSNFKSDNGQLNPMIGIWSPYIQKEFPQLCLDEIFGFLSILRWKNPDDNSMPPMYVQQLSDDSLYLTPYLDRIGVSTREETIQYNLYNPPAKPYVYGFSFERLYEVCPKTIRAVFVLDHKNTAEPNWRVVRPSWSWWWSHILPELQSQEVSGAGVFYPNVSGVNTWLMGPDDGSQVPLNLDMLPSDVPADDTDPFFRDMTKDNPIEQWAARGKRSMALFAQSVKLLRAGEMNPEEFVSKRRIQLQQAKSLLDVVPNMKGTCRATRSIMSSIKKNKFYRDEGTAFLPIDPISPDYEGGCNLTQHISVLLEYNGISTMHGHFQLMHMTVLSGAYPHKSLMANALVYGPPESGKSHISDLLTHLVIPYTIIEEMLNTERADQNENEDCLYNCTVMSHEMPGGFMLDKNDKGNAGTERQNSNKIALTEHKNIMRTCAIVNGRRITMRIEKSNMSNRIINCNIDSTVYMVEALQSRMVCIKVPCAFREGHSLSDYSVWSDTQKSDGGSDAAFLKLKHVIQMTQMTTAFYGTLVYSSVLPPVNLSAFAMIHKLFEINSSKSGQQMTTRGLQKAREFAVSLVFRRIAMDFHLQRYARFSGIFSLHHQFADAQQIACAMVVTEVEAIQAMITVMASFNETDVHRLAVCVLRMMATENKQKDGYSRYFIVPTGKSRQYSGKRGRSNYEDDCDEDESVEIDISRIQIEVGHTYDSLMDWCGRMCKIMQQEYNCSTSSAQVYETLRMIADPQGAWRQTTHQVLNLNFPIDPSDPYTDEYIGERSVLSVTEAARHHNGMNGVSPSDLDLAGKKWMENPKFQQGNLSDMYYPYEVANSSAKIVTTNLDLNGYANTGFIAFSSIFLKTMSGMELGNTHDLINAVCTSNTTPRPIVSVVTPDTMTYGVKLPYAHPGAMLHTDPTRESVVQNPMHASTELWETVVGTDDGPPVGRCNSEVAVPSFVPLDAYISFKHVAALAEDDPMIIPSVHNILPKSCHSSIVCPGILDELEREDAEFAELYKGSGRERDRLLQNRVVAYLQYHQDLVRDCRTDVYGTHVPMDTSREAEDQARIEAKAIAHQVCALSKCPGMGRMRERSINNPDKHQVVATIKALRVAIDSASPDCEYDDEQDENSVNNLRSLPLTTLKERLKRQNAKYEHIKQIENECSHHSAADTTYNSYLEQYRAMIANGDIIRHHRYPAFLKWVRHKSALLFLEQDTRESNWR